MKILFTIILLISFSPSKGTMLSKVRYQSPEDSIFGKIEYYINGQLTMSGYEIKLNEFENLDIKIKDDGRVLNDRFVCRLFLGAGRGGGKSLSFSHGLLKYIDIKKFIRENTYPGTGYRMMVEVEDKLRNAKNIFILVLE
jgi:hypothetical protein